MMNVEQVTMLVSFFNMRAGTRCWANSEKNQRAAAAAYSACGEDMSRLKLWLRDRAEQGERDFEKACLDFVLAQDEIKVAAQQQPSPATPMAGMFEQVCTEMLARLKADEIKDKILEYVKQEYGPVRRRVTVELPERKVEFKEVLHSKFETILKFVRLDEPVFLAGPAGSGKNVICKQIAQALGLNFYFSNAVTQEYKLTGFTDANGTYHESQFYKAFKNGGLFMLDEMDASIPEVLIILNAAIANRYFDFPAPVGYVEAHPDFRVVAAGNTFGNGADYDYVGRSQLDAASLDRFAVVKVDYDPQIEEACANGDMELVGFCRKFRAACVEAGIHTVVSYRAIGRMAKLSACMEPQEIVETCLVKGLDKDSLNIIAADGGKFKGFGRWSDGFAKVIVCRGAWR